MNTPSTSPTWVRWRIVAILMAISFMSWFNRASMAAAGDMRIMSQFNISKETMGTVYSAFLLVYALFMTPGGWFIDRYGAWTALVLMGFGSALFGALTGAVGFIASAALIVPMFLVIRGCMGMFSAPIYPGSGRMVSQWMPFPQRALANGFITCAAPVGIACTFVGFGYLIDQVDWPLAFIITGAITAALAFLWTAYARNRPSQHPGVNSAERQLIIQDDPQWLTPTVIAGESSGVQPKPAAGLSWLLGHRSLMLLTISYGAVNYFEYLFTFWGHHYFDDVLHLGKIESRYYAGVLYLAEAAGMVLGGWLSDRLVRGYGYRFGRAAVPMGGLLLSAGFLGLGLLATRAEAVVGWFSLAVCAIGACEGPFWATAIDIGGSRGGTSAGICNTGGNVGGLIAPIITPWVSGHWGWPWGIGLGSLVCLAGAALWLWIDPTDRMEARDERGFAPSE
jgi:MFS family permease